jgi:hypothetical protein
MATLYARTSGFAYPSRKPGFYPPEASAKHILKHSAGPLDAVEIKYTFRPLPAAATPGNSPPGACAASSGMRARRLACTTRWS